MLFNKHISSILFLCFIVVYAQSIHAMRSSIKTLKLASKTQHNKMLFCNKSDLKGLQQIYTAIGNINPMCFDEITKGDACKYKGSCCLLAKNNAKQAKKGKAVRLQKASDLYGPTNVDNVYKIFVLTGLVKRLATLQQKNAEAQTIFLASHDKEALAPLYKQLRELTRDISECLTYGANIYGITFNQCSERYYQKNPQGLFDSSKDMSLQERERENLQNECNKMYRDLMKSNEYPLNKNILLGWGKYTMDPSCLDSWFNNIKQAMADHDTYKKNGGGVY
jgi:hypothetical protein